jgi:transcription antitermination factor NusG
MQYWYVLHVKPHKERQVALHLQQNQVEAYLPLVKVNPVNPRAARVRALFPNYIFARFDLQTTGLSLVQWTPGVRRLLEFGGQLATVSAGDVAELKRRVAQISESGGLALDGLAPGDRVRVVSGPFAGYEAIFDSRLAGAERVRIFLEWVRHRKVPQAIPVELNVGSIQKVKPRRQRP